MTITPVDMVEALIAGAENRADIEDIKRRLHDWQREVEQKTKLELIMVDDRDERLRIADLGLMWAQQFREAHVVYWEHLRIYDMLGWPAWVFAT
jgi:hypothetical protein